MGTRPTGRRNQPTGLLKASVVFAVCFAVGLVVAGTVSGAGSLSTFAGLVSSNGDTGTATTDTGTAPTDIAPTDTTSTDATTTDTTDTTPTDTAATTPAPPRAPPTIVSDKDDYMPGETVTLTGENWASGESVRITVNDNKGQSWSRSADVIASVGGRIFDQFQLPDWFVATYVVVATGPISGTATTTFTDGNVKVGSANGRHFNYQVTLFSSTNCTSGGGSATTKTADANGSTTGVGSTESLLIVASVNANAPNSTATFSNWTRPGSPAIQFAPGYTATDRTVCVVGFQSGSSDLIGNYAAAPANTAPTANNVSTSTTENRPKAITLSGSDAQQCELTFSIVTGPSSGTLGSISNSPCSASPTADTASVTYTPNPNFSGSDSFTYKVNDGTLDSSVASVSITVTTVDDPPTAVNDSATVTEDSGATSISVLANDTDPDGGPKTIQSVTQPANGSVSVTGGGSGLTYTPNANYCNGGSPVDSFTYTLNGGSTATVAVTVTCVDDAPVIAFASGATAVDEGQTETYVFSITDPDSSSFTYEPGYPKCGAGGTLVGTPSLGTSSGSFQCKFLDGPGSPTIAAQIRDATSASNEATRTVGVANVEPTVSVTGDAAVAEGQTRTYTIATSDPGEETFALTAHSCGSGGSEVAGSLTFNPATGGGSFACKFADGPASASVTATVSDGDGGSDTGSQAVTVANVEPTVTLNGPTSADEGQTKSYSFSFTDPGDDTWTRSVSCGASGTVANSMFSPATKTGSFDCVFADDNPTGTASDTSTVTATVADDDSGSNSDSLSVTVSNVAPAITGMTGPLGPIQLGNSASVTTNYTDVGTQDTHTCTYSWDDGSPSTTVNGTGAGTGSCTGTHSYGAAGVYAIDVTVRDDDTGSATSKYEFVVIYDPSAGFVTGGGWIMSPPGAYTAGPTLSGKANFGFVSKYKKGASVPEGETEFQLHFANFNFHSTSYQWLVVSSNGTKAQYKGEGTINGSGSYGFLLTAYDGAPDRFRIKIWNKTTNAIVYDNRIGTSEDIDAADPQQINGGSIVIHRAK